MVAGVALRHADENTPRAALIRRIAVALLHTPFQSAQLISARLDLPEATPNVVTSLLYSEPRVFEILGTENPAIWAVREAAEALVETWARPQAPQPQPEDSPSVPTPATSYEGPPLRAWQSEALAAWTARDRRGIVEAVTGSGKTAVGTRAVVEAIDDGRQAVILVPGIDLQTQWWERLSAAMPGSRIDRVGGKGQARPPAHWDILVATVQTVSGTPLSVLPGTLLVADEVHRYGAGSYAKALAGEYEWRLGLTATLERNDNAVEEILLPYFGGLIPGCDYNRARADGILAPVRLALTGVHFTARERAKYDRADEAARKAKSVLVDGYGAPEDSFGEFMSFAQRLAKQETGDAARQAQRFLKYFAERRELLADCQGKLDLIRTLPIPELRATQSIFFAERTSTAGQIQSTLDQLGLSCGCVGSALRPAEREQIIGDFQRGDLRALSAPRVLDEGIDIPDAQLGMVLAASRTRRQMIQRMGRVVRPKSNGSAALFVVAYVYGTPEDPALGAHEAFLEDLESIAEQRATTDAAGLPGVLRSWLSEANTQPTAPEPPVTPEFRTPPQESRPGTTPAPAELRAPTEPSPATLDAPIPDESRTAGDVPSDVPTPLEVVARTPKRDLAPGAPAGLPPASPSPTLADLRAPVSVPPRQETETTAPVSSQEPNSLPATVAADTGPADSTPAELDQTPPNPSPVVPAELAAPTIEVGGGDPVPDPANPVDENPAEPGDHGGESPRPDRGRRYYGEPVPPARFESPSAATTYRRQVEEMLGMSDVSSLWSDTATDSPLMNFDEFVEWQSDTLFYLSRPWDGDIDTWRRTMRAIVDWAASPADPIDSFLDVNRAASEVGPSRTEMLRFAAVMRGCELADLL
ncbi:DEAD/DEAH box helicase family protein [Nocardia tengchongensis]|uniref:DEAD/DEAH box helicase family protein n=1 Tax=Nocardia tengchongensis TaxID=2055889 RepID=UPI003609FF9B